MKDTNILIDILDLEQIELNIFRGKSFPYSWGRIYGGHVLAQALRAAYQTVPKDRMAHSMHGYFILPGNVDIPIIYEVDRIRDGRSFTTRRIVAIQNGRAIFNSAVSFQLRQEGLDHQIPMPNVPMPENLMSEAELRKMWENELPEVYKKYKSQRPIEFRPVEKIHPAHPRKYPPLRHIWLRPKGTLTDQFSLHQEVLAFASDYNLLATGLLPHRDQVTIDQIQIASLDHAMWFHREFRMNDWLLYALDSPSGSNARGFTRGNIFTKDGKLVASVVQEGLLRKISKTKKD